MTLRHAPPAPPLERPLDVEPALGFDLRHHAAGAFAPASPAVRPAIRASAANSTPWVIAALLVFATAAAAVVQPAWPAQFMQSLLWFGGVWRPLAVPGATALIIAVVALNATAPGAVWAAVVAGIRRLGAPVVRVLACAVGLFSVAYSAGLLGLWSAPRALFFFLLQVALFPGLPLLILLWALLLTTLAADARGVRLWSWLRVAWTSRPRAIDAAVRGLLPAGLVWLAGALIAAALFPDAMQGWGRPDPVDAQRFNFYASFFNFSYNDDHVLQRSGFDLGGCGLMLAPGESGSVSYRLQRTPESLVLLKANFYNRATACQVDSPAEPPPATFTNAIELSTDQGHTFQPVLRDSTVGQIAGDTAQDLTALLGSSRDYVLRFSATNTTSQRVTVLPSFVVSVVVDPLATPHPSFPVVPCLGTAALLAFVLARQCGLRGRPSAAVAVLTALAGGTAAATALRLAAGPDGTTAGVGGALWVVRTLVVALLVALAVSATFQWSHQRRVAPLRTPATRHVVPWLCIACLAVSLLALDLRWAQLIAQRYEFLLPDAQGYQSIAVEFPQKMAHYESQRPSRVLDELYAAGFDGRANAAAVFYAGGNNGREPLWSAVLRLAYDVIGVSQFHTRLVSLALSVLVAVLTTFLGWRVVHPVVGVTAGVLVATSASLVTNSVAGLREELVGALCVAIVAVLFAGARRGVPPGWWRVAGAGAVAGGLVLVRADMVILAGAAVTLAALALRWPWPRWVAAVAVIGVLAGPMYVGYAFTHGDAFYPGTYGATVNRNLEFPERMGTPGFPTVEEYAANWAAGPSISPMRYFFGYHTVPQFTAYALRGFVRIFRDILFVGWERWLEWPLVLGAVLLVVMRRWLVPATLVVGLMPFYAFLAGVPNPWVFPARYAYHIYPFAALAIAYGVWWLPLWLGDRWNRRVRWHETSQAV